MPSNHMAMQQQWIGLGLAIALPLVPMAVAPARVAASTQLQSRSEIVGHLEKSSNTLLDGRFFASHAFEGRAGERIAIALASDAFHPLLVLLDPAGNPIANNSRRRGDVARIALELPAPGRYTIRAVGEGAGAIGRYHLSWRAATAAEVQLAADLAESERLNREAYQRYDRKDYASAIPLMERVLAVRQRLLEGDRADIAQSLNDLAFLYRTQERYDEAEPLYQESLAMRRRLSAGQEGVAVVSSLKSLAALYQAWGKPAEAEPLLQEVLAINRRRYGQTHAEVARSLEALAKFYESQWGQQEQAIASYLDAAGVWEALEAAPQQVAALLKVVNLHHTAGRGDRMLQYAQQALSVSREARQPHLEAFSLFMVGNAYLRLQDARQALAYFQQSIPVFQAANLPEQATVVQNSIGIAHQQLGEPEAAIAAYNGVLEHHRRQDNVGGQSQILGLLAAIYTQIGNTESAKASLLQALALHEGADNTAGQAKTYSSLGILYFSLGENRQSIAAHKKAIALYEGLQAAGESLDRFSYVRALEDLGSVHFREGRFEEAFAAYERALQSARETGIPDLVSTVLSATSLRYESLGDTQQALDLMLAAAEVWRSSNQPAREGTILSAAADLYFTLGELQKALDTYARALQLQRSVGARPDEASTLLPLADTYRELGDYDLALETYDLALNLFEQVGDLAGKAKTHDERAWVYYEQKKYRKALATYERSLQLHRQQQNRLQEMRVLVNQARTYEALEQYPQALAAAAQIASIAEDVGSETFAGFAAGLRGRIHLAAGEPRKALAALLPGLEILETQKHHLGKVNTLQQIGKAHQALDELPQAIAVHTQVLGLRREAGDRLGEASALYDLARVERQRQRLPEAQNHAEAALEIVESLRGTLVGPALRTSYLATVYEYYEFYIDLLMERHQRSPEGGFDARALHASERSRARGLLELLAEANAEIERGVEPQLLAQARSLQQRLQQNEERRAQLYDEPGPSKALAQQLERKHQQLLSQYRDTQDRIRAASPRYAALQYPEPLALQAIQAQVLDGETLLLQYSLGEERSYLWAIARDELHSYELPDRATIEAAARTLRREIVRGTPTPRGAARLTQMLLAPAAARLQEEAISRVVIVGDGVLQYVPFAALPLPGSVEAPLAPEPLLSRYEVTSLPSSSTLSILRQFDNPIPASQAVAIFADPVFASKDSRVKEQPDPSSAAPTPPPTAKNLTARRAQATLARVTVGDRQGWARLPGTRREAEAIARLFAAGDLMQRYDFDANYQAATTTGALEDYRFVHFATHGLLDSTNPELSGLVLSLVDRQGRPQNGYLRLHDIFNLELAADLVVLSACQTGLGQTIRGEGVVGMTRGFMYAGAPRVVVSLWSVDDAATAALMTAFYQNMLERQLAPAAALREAQLSVRQDPRWASPFYWAGFVLQGEWQW